MIKRAIALIAATTALGAFAITATKEYVDEKNRAQNAVIDALATTNATLRAELAETARQVASNETAIATKADAEKTVSISTGGASTNLVVRPVYANVNLVIREVETANGQRQFRLIRREDD